MFLVRGAHYSAMCHKALLPLFLLIICESSLFAQNKYDISQFRHETVDFIKQPAKWDGSDWLKIGVMGAGTFLILETADQPIRDEVLKDRSYYKSAPMEFGRMWGELYMPVILFGGFAVHSLITNDMRSRKIAYEVGQASLYAGGLTFLLKMAIGRSRPGLNEGPKTFHPFGVLFFKRDYQSLPGGHNAAAFVLSTVLSRNAKPGWLKGLAYLPAGLTFVSRVYQDQHWTSDDFFGAALGYFVATWVVDHHQEEENGIHAASVLPLSISIALD